MSGHSKWSTIKRKKGVLDAKRAQFFSKIIREITAAVKQGGNDVESNPRLRLAIQNAKGANMPKENIERAINKGNTADAADFTTITYEGNAPHGAALIVECTTDNLNRTVANVRTIFSKHGGSLGKNGSVTFLFDRKGTFTIPERAVADIEALTLSLIEVGADDIEHDTQEAYYYVICPVEQFGAIQKELDNLHIEVESAELRYIPHTQVELHEEAFEKVMKLIEALEENDDVQKVYHNVTDSAS
jgi:YebC/PmpR family DNA-binding regulatory protein